MYSFNEQNYEAFKTVYQQVSDRSALTFLSNYDANDLSAIILGPNSTSLWIISPPDLNRLKDDLMKNVTLKVQYKYIVSRVTNTDKIAGTITRERSFDLKSETPARKELLDMLNQVSNQKPTQLPFLFPKFLKVKQTTDFSKNRISLIIFKICGHFIGKKSRRFETGHPTHFKFGR